jgi:caprin-1
MVSVSQEKEVVQEPTKGASPGPETDKQASANTSNLAAAVAIVEKKVRNLEKRKGKLDGYREDSRRGKELNNDQQAAVAKYDEVIGTLEFARELTGQFGKLALDEAKDRKKTLKKEQQERARQELVKVTYVMGVREVLNSLLEEGVVQDLLEGTNGAPKLSEQQVEQMQLFQQLATPDRYKHISKSL